MILSCCSVSRLSRKAWSWTPNDSPRWSRDHPNCRRLHWKVLYSDIQCNSRSLLGYFLVLCRSWFAAALATLPENAALCHKTCVLSNHLCSTSASHAHVCGCTPAHTTAAAGMNVMGTLLSLASSNQKCTTAVAGRMQHAHTLKDASLHQAIKNLRQPSRAL